MVAHLFRSLRVASLLLVLLPGCAKNSQDPESVVAAPAGTVPPPVSSESSSAAPALRLDAPESYVVQRGDTLWDISNRYLADPWYWPEIWNVNPQIRNPHLIYPGDVLTIFYVQGAPRVGVTGGPRISGDGLATTTGPKKLQPRIREESLDLSPQGIPIQSIGPFLIRPRVVGADELRDAGYIVASESGRLIFGNNDQVYVRGLGSAEVGSRHSVFRPGEIFKHPETGELLGYEAVLIADGEVIRSGEPATLSLFNPTGEALTGDRVLPILEESDHTFFPSEPKGRTRGWVLSLFDAMSETGALKVVAISLGAREGVAKGNVFSVYQAPRTVLDRISEKPGDTVRLPEEFTGLIMVFRVFDRVSYALVMESIRPVREGDVLGPPTR